MAAWRRLGDLPDPPSVVKALGVAAACVLCGPVVARAACVVTPTSWAAARRALTPSALEHALGTFSLGAFATASAVRTVGRVRAVLASESVSVDRVTAAASPATPLLQWLLATLDAVDRVVALGRAGSEVACGCTGVDGGAGALVSCGFAQTRPVDEGCGALGSS